MTSTAPALENVQSADPAGETQVPPTGSGVHGELAGRITALMHDLGRFKHQITSSRRESEVAYNMILFHLVNSGPVRAGVLAENLNADPSTVSRQVSALVKDGLIERQADPEDGRASLLAATAAGEARFAGQVARRNLHYRRMLADWDEADVAVFTEHVARFTDAFENYKPQLLAELGADGAPGTGAGRPAAGREEN